MLLQCFLADSRGPSVASAGEVVFDDDGCGRDRPDRQSRVRLTACESASWVCLALSAEKDVQGADMWQQGSRRACTAGGFRGLSHREGFEVVDSTD